MIDKILIANKLDKFLKTTKLESFLKVFLISFFYDKVNYMEQVIDYEDCLKMLDKYIYNLEQNLKTFKTVKKYDSIYARYDFESKTLFYNITNNYRKLKSVSISEKYKKECIIKEFKLMMYKEFDVIVNIYAINRRIISNGFYVADRTGRYPEYEGDYSNIMDIFANAEVCNFTNVDDRIKTYVDKEKRYFVYSNHLSNRNSEVIGYVELLRSFIDNKLYYFAINNPKRYSEKMINDFNIKYNFIINAEYNFLLSSKDIFSLIEKYLLHIKDRVNAENNVQYHQDLSVIFKLMDNRKHSRNFSEHILHSSNKQNRLNFVVM